MNSNGMMLFHSIDRAEMGMSMVESTTSPEVIGVGQSSADISWAVRLDEQTTFANRRFADSRVELIVV